MVTHRDHGDEDPEWIPPVPEKHAWNKKLPAEGDARAYFGDIWVIQHSTVVVPEDLCELLGTSNSLFVVDDHVLNQVVPGFKHHNAVPYVEHLQEAINRSDAASLSLRNHGNSRRVELYLHLPDGSGFLAILGLDTESGRTSVMSAYVLGTGTMENRKKSARVVPRQQDKR